MSGFSNLITGVKPVSSQTSMSFQSDAKPVEVKQVKTATKTRMSLDSERVPLTNNQAATVLGLLTLKGASKSQKAFLEGLFQKGIKLSGRYSNAENLMIETLLDEKNQLSPVQKKFLRSLLSRSIMPEQKVSETLV